MATRKKKTTVEAVAAPCLLEAPPVQAAVPSEKVPHAAPTPPSPPPVADPAGSDETTTRHVAALQLRVAQFNERADPRANVAESRFALNYLNAFGYLARELSGWKDVSLGDIVDAVTSFQQFFGLRQTGQVDARTVRAMEVYRCGCPDLVQVDHPVGQEYLKVAQFAEARLPAWRKTAIKYCIEEYVGGLGKTEQDDIIDKAFQAWEDVCGINIERSRDSNCDILVGTGRGQRSNFDGAGGVLAWAYLPDGNDQQLVMKFDLDETWLGIGGHGRGILMFNVACHEFGHLLGLDHSRVQTALMAPYYSPETTVPQANDDVPRIVARYGLRTGGPTPPAPPGAAASTIVIEGATRILLNGQQIA